MIEIGTIDHVGLRVTDLARSQAFYAKLGFAPEPGEDTPDHHALGLINAAGTRINLIYNGQAHPQRNILMDVPERWPGYTHAAFLVPRLDTVLDWARDEGVAITEGPIELGGRRIVAFLRDPDGNVLEFDELLLLASGGPA
jgi:catechol 2,3-dioxygenase-like lactoylglutathione lyase family enzyme